MHYVGKLLFILEILKYIFNFFFKFELKSNLYLPVTNYT